jgi:outer membrane protein assembly factor BamB
MMLTTRTILPPKIVLSQSMLYASQGGVYALDLNSGTIHWNYSIRGQAYPTVSNDRLYVNVSHHPDYTVQAFRENDTTPLWNYRIEGRLMDAPSVADEVIFISTAEGTIYAIQASDGTFLWRSAIDFDPDVPDALGPTVFASPLVVDNVVYLATAANAPLKPFIYAFQAKDGTLLWKAQIEASTSFPLAINRGVIYISTYSGCLALQANNGSSIWQYQADAQMCSQPIIMNDVVYISVSKSRRRVSQSLSHKTELQQQAFLCALRANDGSLLWQQQLGIATQTDHPTCPVVTGDAIYIGANDGCLSALQISDGALIWRYQTGGTLLSSPLEANGVVYVGANDGYVYAFQASDGTLLWQTFVSVATTVASSIVNLSKEH